MFIELKFHKKKIGKNVFNVNFSVACFIYVVIQHCSSGLNYDYVFAFATLFCPQFRSSEAIRRTFCSKLRNN